MKAVFKNMELLEIIEAYALDNDGIESEGQLSEIFDQEVLPGILALYGADDEPAINEAFLNWSDGLTRDGYLHSLQYENYCYIGKYSN